MTDRPNYLDRKQCENCGGNGGTDMGYTICPDCLGTGFVCSALTAYIAEARRLQAAARVRAASPDGEGWRWSQDGMPTRDGNTAEQWLLTWCEDSATCDVACIDASWTHGQLIKLLGMDAWKWIVPPDNPAPVPLSADPATPRDAIAREAAERERADEAERERDEARELAAVQQRGNAASNAGWTKELLERTADRKQAEAALTAANARIAELSARVGRVDVTDAKVDAALRAKCMKRKQLDDDGFRCECDDICKERWSEFTDDVAAMRAALEAALAGPAPAGSGEEVR